jgi:hypothetical protein
VETGARQRQGIVVIGGRRDGGRGELAFTVRYRAQRKGFRTAGAALGGNDRQRRGHGRQGDPFTRAAPAAAAALSFAPTPFCFPLGTGTSSTETVLVPGASSVMRDS